MLSYRNTVLSPRHLVRSCGRGKTAEMQVIGDALRWTHFSGFAKNNTASHSLALW